MRNGRHHHDWRGMVLAFLDWLMHVSSFAALGMLVAVHGFYLPEKLHDLLWHLTAWVLTIFMLQWCVRVVLSRDRMTLIRENQVQILMILLLPPLVLLGNIASLFFSQEIRVLRGRTVMDIYFLVAPFLAVIVAGIHSLRFSDWIARLQIHPARLALIILVTACVVGGLALKMPKAAHEQIAWIDAFFMATSAVCVTGLSTLDPGSALTPLGQAILLFLIQIGGLGIMTISMLLFSSFGGSVGVRQKVVMQDMLQEESLGEVVAVMRRIFGITVALEAIGATVLFFAWADLDPDLDDRLWLSVFHGVSAFCNAGFSLLPNNMAQEGYVTNSTGLLTLSCLVIMGGLGYPVLNNLIAWAKSRRKPVKVRMNIHTRLVLWGTVTLLVVGTSFLLVSENDRVFAGFTPGQKIVQAFFQSVMPRTAGFNSVTLADCTTPGLVCIICLMFIGAAPASTAGGIKVTTAAVVLAFLRSLVTSSPKVNILRREISQDLILRAVGITLCALMFMVTCAIALTAIEEVSFLDAVFETVSALSTVGLTVGITAKATVWGKLILMLCMIVGRLGVLTVAWAFFLREREIPFEYPRERVMLM